MAEGAAEGGSGPDRARTQDRWPSSSVSACSIKHAALCVKLLGRPHVARTCVSVRFQRIHLCTRIHACSEEEGTIVDQAHASTPPLGHCLARTPIRSLSRPYKGALYAPNGGSDEIDTASQQAPVWSMRALVARFFLPFPARPTAPSEPFRRHCLRALTHSDSSPEPNNKTLLWRVCPPARPRKD